MPVSRPVALVTGAARRLGREIALELARGGHDIALHFRSGPDEAQATVEELRAIGVEAAAFQADLADEGACRALVPAVLARLGRLDAVVNSAALFEFDDAASFGYAMLERHLRANTGPAVLLAQALAQHLAQRPGARGAVVNLLDQKLWNPNPDYFSYTLSKAALECATQLLARALAPAVRVVGVAPGLTLTSTTMSPERFEELHRLSPLGRSSTPADVAAGVRFLIQNGSITGTTLLVDGGQHMMALARDFSKM